MLTSREHIEAQGYERRRILAALMEDPRLIASSPWRPVAVGALLAGVLIAASAALRLVS